MKLHLERPLYPFFRMQMEEDLILSLIQKELHIHWLLRDLENVGFDSSFQPISLEAIILVLVGINRPGDDTYIWFMDKLTEHIEKLEENKDQYSTSEAAMEIYHALKERKHSGVDNPSSQGLSGLK